MKKIFIIVICAFLLVGCGHKSNSEITDIEQFRCQDSIETVFSVLGNTEMKNSSSGGNYYKYEGLNLWGYNGEVVFVVRDDGDTIQNFYCYLVLNQNEFEDLISYFSDKYGSYESSEFGETIKTYEWTVPEEGFGYSSITIQYNGDKEYVVTFSDEFSYMNDEEYYEKIESDKSKESLNIIKSKEYDLEDGDSLSLSMLDDDGELNLNISAKIANEEKASIAYLYLFAMVFDENLSDYAHTYTITSDSGTVLFTENGTIGTNGDEAVLSEPSWLILDTDKWTMSDEEQRNFRDALWNSIFDFMDDFIEDEE